MEPTGRTYQDGTDTVLLPNRQRELEKLAFEHSAKTCGYNVTRASKRDTVRPWREYQDAITGHRWAGWLAARDYY